ncbi:MAG TPA: hypothetical protein VG164_13405 [Trebonia sp.]|nr:hypothetical protein [Trebonia sp.]
MTEFTGQDLSGARRCLRAIVNEEWEHRLYAEPDLDVLEARLP